MARLAAAADGNLTTSATWVVIDAPTALVTEGGTSTTALTTSSQNSANITPTSDITIDAIAIKVSNVAGTTGTLTLTLYNVTTTASVVSLAIPVADLPSVTTNGAGTRAGWLLFGTGDQNLTSGSNYQVRLNLSSGSSAVSVMTNGTTANWQHLFRTKTAAAPGAGDDLFVLGLWTASGTWTQYTVVMDNTAATTFGSNPGASTPTERSGLFVGRSTVACGTTASTAYVLQMAGCINAAYGGTITFGTAATPVPATSSFTLTFYTSNSYAISAWLGGTVEFCGSARTAGKNIVHSFLTADISSGSTSSLSISNDPGWKSGDLVWIGTSTPGSGQQAAQYTLASDATSGSITLTGAVSAAYKGTSPFPFPAPICLATHNVTITTSNTSSIPCTSACYNTGSFSMRWTKAFNLGLSFPTFSGSATLQYVCIDHTPQGTIDPLGATGICSGTLVVRDLTYIGSTNTEHVSFQFTQGSTYTNYILQDIIVIQDSASNGTGFGATWGAGGTCKAIRVYGGNARCYISKDAVVNSGFPTDLYSDCVVFGGSSGYSLNLAGFNNITITNLRFRGNNLANLNGSMRQITFESCVLCPTAKLLDLNVSGGTIEDVVFSNCTITGLTAFSDAPADLLKTGAMGQLLQIRFLNCDFTPAWGTMFSNSLAELSTGGTAGSGLDVGISFVDCYGTLSVPVRAAASSYPTARAFVSFNNFHRTAGDHRVYRPYYGITSASCAVLQTDGTTFNTAAPSEKMTPLSASRKLASSIKRCAVASGQTATITVYVRKSAAYAGAEPRLIIKRNDTAGITADTVGDTLSVAADTWEQLTYTTAAVADDCVLEAYVDCDGTAGVVYVDDWAAS